MNSFIYLVDFGEVVKVGVSRHPETRFRALAKQFDLSVIDTFICQTGNAYKIEKMTKEAFSHKVKPWGGVTTETFSCSMGSLKEYILGAIGSMPEVVAHSVISKEDHDHSLSSYIDKNHNGSTYSFAQSVGVSTQKIKRWIEQECIFLDGEVYAPKTSKSLK